MDGVSILVAVLEAAAQAAPGLIATWTGHADDKAAISALKAQLAARASDGKSASEHAADDADLAARKAAP